MECYETLTVLMYYIKLLLLFTQMNKERGFCDMDSLKKSLCAFIKASEKAAFSFITWFGSMKSGY